jgi:hypothetical protein
MKRVLTSPAILLMCCFFPVISCIDKNGESVLDQTGKPDTRDESCNCSSEFVKNLKPVTIKINRKTKVMNVLDNQGNVILNSTVGIGRGGLNTKSAMSDLITPTGTMRVDLILYKEISYNAIDPSIRNKFLNSEYKEYVNDNESLNRLFQNMNRLDFDGDGLPDNSYGIAYIGLSSAVEGGGVTGPKMRYANWKGAHNIPYWYSIALHGTLNENDDLGAANSGGCVHVAGDVLTELIESGMVDIGTRVIIFDEN